MNETKISKKEVIKILEKLQKTFKEKESKCYEDIAFMREHKFKMEEEAIRYKLGAYNDAWLTVWQEIDNLKDK